MNPPSAGPGFERYERVTFDPAVLIGKWEWDRSGEDPDDPRFFEFEITLDHAKFTFNPHDDPEQARTITRGEGVYTVDPATLYLDLKHPISDRYDRFALAPTDKSPMEIVVSAYWSEKGGFDERPYGDYWLHMRKLEAAAE